MVYKAFEKFSEYGLEDYIIRLNWKIKAKSFPLSKHTLGNSGIYIQRKHENCSPDYKVFKNIFEENVQQNISSETNSEVSFDVKQDSLKDTINQENSYSTNSFNNYTQTNTVQNNSNIFKNIIDSVTSVNNTRIENLENKVFDTAVTNTIQEVEKVVEKVVEAKIENIEADTFIANLIEQQNDLSSNITLNQILELEQNLKNISSSENFITQQNIINFENKIENKHENLKKEVSVEIKKQKDFIEKFLNN